MPASLPFLFTALKISAPAASSARSSASSLVDSGRARGRDPELQPVLRQLAAEPLGHEHRRGRAGDPLLLVVAIAERLIVHRRPGERRMRTPPPSRSRIASKRFAAGRCPGARQDIDLDIAAPRVRLADRPVGLRQVDAPADHRRPDPPDRGESSSTASPRTRHGSTATTGSSSRTPCSTTGAPSPRTSRCRSRWPGWDRPGASARRRRCSSSSS